MNNADRTYDGFGPGDPNSYGPVTVEDLLSQLDRVDAHSAPPFDPRGLDQLMSWMESDDACDPDPAATDTDAGASPNLEPVTAKFLIAGGEYAGTADFIDLISDRAIHPDDSALTEAAPPSTARPTRLYFGRTTVSEDIRLWHVSASGHISAPMWDWLVRGTLGALVLADTRRLRDCHFSLDYLDSCGLPYVVVLRGSSERCPYTLAQIREALALDDDVPILFWEAGRRLTAASALIAVVEHALERCRKDQSQGDEPLDEELIALTLLAQLELLLQ